MGSDSQEEVGKEKYTKRDIHWPGVLLQIYTIAIIFYGCFFVFESKFLTILFEVFLISAGIFGVTAGAHRLWAHRSYEATPTLRFILMICQTLTLQEPIYDWVLNHRIHHKFHGTDDDPYNYKRGWFYAHIGNKVLKDNPRRKELVKQIDMKDIEDDKIVMFQKKYHWLLLPIVGIILPMNAPIAYWEESLVNSLMIIGMQRVAITIQLKNLVNSAQTIWGLTPGDRFFQDSNWIYVIRKSYWHEYHYTVPWDYKTNEFGSYNRGDTTVLIKILAAIGMAYNLRTIDSKGMRRALELFVDTGKPLQECINQIEEDIQQYLPEDHYLDQKLVGQSH